MILMVSQTFVSTAGLILKSPSYSSALSIILALTTVPWFVMGLNTLSCQISVLGPIGDVGICSHQLHHLCCVGDLLGQWTCVQSSEYQHHHTVRGKQVGRKKTTRDSEYCCFQKFQAMMCEKMQAIIPLPTSPFHLELDPRWEGVRGNIATVFS